ncbi:MAG: hypothetical protein VB096_01890 [Pseudoflavonifractor sp.]|nr:hypothetical protein [Pseudoflavonifractor sp.]
MSYRKRTIYLILGQVVSAIGIVGMVQANIGLDPWNCLHQGLSNVTGLSFGICTILIGTCAILISFLLKEPLGLGTVVNVLCPGLLIDLIQHFHLIPRMNGLWSGIAMMLAGQAVLALGTYYYMAAAMGAGPRDSLMVAVSRPLHLSPGLCRSALEVLAVFLGWLMGAKVGVGTVLSALTIGFFLQGVFALFHYDPKAVHHASFSELWAVFHGWVTARGAQSGEAEPIDDSTPSTHV